MKIDLHFYGTYAIARLAGFEPTEAQIIATAAQFVDDATDNNSEKNSSGEMLFSIATAHHLKDAGSNSFFHPEIHRLIWVPFHFYPGGRGDTLEEKLLCTKNSEIVNEMFNNHLALNSDKSFYLHLLGVASHVYLDTFAHYGFSGICSTLNEVIGESISLNTHDRSVKDRIEKESRTFFENCETEIKGFFIQIQSSAGEKLSRGLGHGAVSTYPDQPYLNWHFIYEEARYGNGKQSGERNNQKTYLEGLQELHKKLSIGAKKLYSTPTIRQIPEKSIKGILALELDDTSDRCDAWKKFIADEIDDGKEAHYLGDEWNRQKDRFNTLNPPNHISDCYKFHQAAVYHRWYSLKDLFPEHGIYVV